MAKFRAGPQLEQRVTQRFAAPRVRRLRDELADRLRANAPDARTWVTAQDERVRKSHRDADGQTIPANLRYVIAHPSGVDRDGGGGEGGADEMARAPRDPNLSIGNRINCRCIDVALPGLIAEHVSAGDVTVRRSSARAVVSIEFPRIRESNHPDTADSGGGWVARAVRETAAGASRRR